MLPWCATAARVTVTIAVVLTASTLPAAALEIPIPFAPPIPSVFLVEEAHSVRSHIGETKAGASRARLEFLERDGTAFRILWTVLEAEGERLPGLDVADLLVGMPLSLTLDAGGAPRGVADLGSLRAHLLEDVDGDYERELPLFLRNAEAPPSLAAMVLTPPLAVTSSCQNTNLDPGVPSQSEQSRSIEGDFLSHRRVTKELRSVDADTAHVVATTLSEVRGPAGAASSSVPSTLTRLECVLDRPSGVVRSATYSVGISGEAEEWSIHMRISVTAQ